MSKIKSIDIKCLNCGGLLPSPIFFDNLDALLSNLTVITGNLVQCHHCNKTTACNRENMRVRGEDGGHLGIETI